jgi:hypothetical protein
MRLIWMIWAASALAGCARAPGNMAPCRCEAAACSAADATGDHLSPLDAHREKPPGLDQRRDSARDRQTDTTIVDHYLHFDTTSDYVRLDGVLDWGVDFTVALKIRLTAAPAAYKDYIACFDYDPLTETLSGWELGFEANVKPRFWVVNKDKDPYPNLCNVGASSSLSTGVWYNVAFTVDYNAGLAANALYVNGVLVAQSSTALCQKTFTPGPLPLIAPRLGGMDEVRFDADDLRVFNKSITAAQAAALHGGQIPAGQILHWAMNEGSGTTLQDATGNGHTGTLHNSSWQTY